MHRGSSKGAGDASPPPEPLPLSASPELLTIVVEVARAGRSEVRECRVVPGSTVRSLLKELGRAPEGCAVMVGGQSVPLDTPFTAPGRITVLPTFSGG